MNNIKNNKRKSILANIVIIFLLVGYTFLVMPIELAIKHDLLNTFLFLLIALWSIIGITISSNKRPYSVDLVHWLFIYFFIFCGGINQFANEKYCWALNPNLKEITIANMLIILWCFFYSFSKIFKIRFKNKKNNALRKNFSFSYDINVQSFSLILSILLLIGLLTIYKYGFGSLFIRSVHNNNNIISNSNSQSIISLVTSLITGFCMWLLNSALISYRVKKNNKYLILALLSTITCLINVPPTGVARFVTGTVYGGVLISNYKNLKKNYIFPFVIVFSILVVFPFLNIFRGLTFDGNINKFSDLVNFIESGNYTDENRYLHADYDAYSMIVYCVRYCDLFDITYCRQLLGVLLFFIPRKIWSGKPYGSGATIINTLQPSIPSNVSCPLIAEGFINMGIIGVILFSFIFGVITKKIDSLFWDEYNDDVSFNSMIYSCLVPFTMFILRGDLLSTFSYLIGFVVSLMIFAKFVIMTRSNKGVNI